MADDLREADEMQRNVCVISYLRRYAREPVKLTNEPLVGDVAAQTHDNIAHAARGDGCLWVSSRTQERFISKWRLALVLR